MTDQDIVFLDRLCDDLVRAADIVDREGSDLGEDCLTLIDDIQDMLNYFSVDVDVDDEEEVTQH